MCPYRVTPEILDQLKRQKRDFRNSIVLCLEFLAEYWLDATAGEGRISRALNGFGVSSGLCDLYIRPTATLQPVSTASTPHSAIAFTLSGYLSNARDLISERYTLASSCVCSSRQARRLCRRLVPEPAERIPLGDPRLSYHSCYQVANPGRCRLGGAGMPTARYRSAQRNDKGQCRRRCTPAVRDCST